MTLNILGRFELSVRHGGVLRDITTVFTPKQRELLAFLAVHGREGARREAVNRALWPGSPPTRPYNSLHNALSLLRRAACEAAGAVMRDVVVRSGCYYRINGAVVNVDYWQFQQALDTGNAEHAAEFYRGELGEEISSLWIELPREAARRKLLDGLGAVIRDGELTNAAGALEVLERIRLLDVYNESVYRDIIRAQVKTGAVDAAGRTFRLLVSVLRDIGQRPNQETAGLLRHAPTRRIS